MLKTRVLTALVLLAVLVPVLVFNHFPTFVLVTVVFLAASVWECLRLCSSKRAITGAAIWTIAFGVAMANNRYQQLAGLYALCVVIWIIRLAPALAIEIPSFAALAGRLLSWTYLLTIWGCFVAIAALFARSPLYLFSVLAIVWIADIGAYFAGKAFGRLKLAPTISPGKSWEGAIGGWLAVLLAGSFTIGQPALLDTFAVRLHTAFGWLGMLCALTLVVVLSVIGDLFESKLKRRAGMKDSSNLLPGHGGVLDRIDALVPVLPFAMLLTYWS